MRSPKLIHRVATLLPLLLLVYSPLAAQRAAAPVRIGLVDSRKLLQDMPGRAQAESQFALEMANARTLVHTATDSMRVAVDELSRTEADLRPQQREAAGEHRDKHAGHPRRDTEHTPASDPDVLFRHG